ncbi:MAG: tetratricopeptide repeat protein [Pseudomonadota bacterium]
MLTLPRLIATAFLSASLIACASGPDFRAEHGTAEDTVAQHLPATPAAREAANRADPLTRADFWGREYAKTPEHLETTIFFMDALEGIGSNERIVDVANDTLPIHPRNADVLLHLARALSRMQRHDQAIATFEAVLEIDPGHTSALAGQALAFDKTGRHEKAQTLYARALALEPGRVLTRTNYGLSLALTGDIEAAEAQLQLAAQSPEASSAVRQNLALIQGLKGDFAAARETSSIDMASDTITANLNVLQSIVTPSRSYEALAASEASAPTAAVETKKKRGLRGL